MMNFRLAEEQIAYGLKQVEPRRIGHVPAL